MAKIDNLKKAIEENDTENALKLLSQIKLEKQPVKSWYARNLGRSLIRMLIGNFFENKNNAATIIGIMLVGTLCMITWTKLTGGHRLGEIEKEVEILANVIFVIVGYYFGSKEVPVSKENT